MREILFRGKDIVGNWYAGNLAVVKENMHNGAGTIEAGSYISNEYGKPFAYQVRPETVSQFTGLTDKNGKKIFEGDIIEVDFDNDGPTIGKQKAFIEYSQHHTAFMVRPIKDWAFCEMTEGKVIGNIHDNPELIQEN